MIDKNSLFGGLKIPKGELGVKGILAQDVGVVWGGVWQSLSDFAEEGSRPPIANFIDTAFIPEHFDERIPAQGSVFMCEPRGKKIPWTLHVNLRDKMKTVGGKDSRTCRVRIPKEFREPLREQLDLVGVNRATLFPDLGSAAMHLAWAVHQRKRP